MLYKNCKFIIYWTLYSKIEVQNISKRHAQKVYQKKKTEEQLFYLKLLKEILKNNFTQVYSL